MARQLSRHDLMSDDRGSGDRVAVRSRLFKKQSKLFPMFPCAEDKVSLCVCVCVCVCASDDRGSGDRVAVRSRLFKKQSKLFPMFPCAEDKVSISLSLCLSVSLRLSLSLSLCVCVSVSDYRGSGDHMAVRSRFFKKQSMLFPMFPCAEDKVTENVCVSD
jgi:hypothetical protein